MHFKTCEAVADRIGQLLTESFSWEQLREKMEGFKDEYKGDEQCSNCRRKLKDLIEKQQQLWLNFQTRGWPFVLVKEIESGQEFELHPYMSWMIIPIEINNAEIDITPWIRQKIIPSKGEIFIPENQSILEGMTQNELRTYVKNHTVPLTFLTQTIYICILIIFFITYPFRWLWDKIKSRAR